MRCVILTAFLLLVGVLVAAAAPSSEKENLTLLDEGFSEYELGNLLPQNAAWSVVPVDDGSTREAAIVRRSDGQILAMTLENKNSWATFVLENDLARAETFSRNHAQVMSFKLDVRYPCGYYKGSSLAVVIVGASGPIGALEYGDDKKVRFNGNEVRAPCDDRWHSLKIRLDTRTLTATLYVDNRIQSEQPFTYPAKPDQIQKLRLVLKLLGNRNNRSAEAEIGSLQITAAYVDEIYVDEGFAQGLSDNRAEVYKLLPSEFIFRSQDFRWKRVPEAFRGKYAIRTRLNGDDSVRLHFREPGRLYAVLWRWDYGFLENLPKSQTASLNGWVLENRSGAEIRDTPQPFTPLPLYYRDFSAGMHAVQLAEYFGKWAIVGFVPDKSSRDRYVAIPRVRLRDARTVHNIFDPGSRVEVVSDGSVDSVELFRKQRRRKLSYENTFMAPELPGRYCVKVNMGQIHLYLPLTVGYGSSSKTDWGPDFFPIHFYTGYSYQGLFLPNAEKLGDLQILAMLDLGANTYFSTDHNEVLSALGVRRIIYKRNDTRAILRSKNKPSRIRALMEDLYTGYAPTVNNAIGFYIEDEPPGEIAEHMRIAEQTRKELGLKPHFLYTLYGDRAIGFWKTVKSTVRMTRSYPIRKSNRGQINARIRQELAEYIERCQKADQSTPLWIVVQAFGDGRRPNIWDAPTPGQLRMMVNLALSRGAKAITYFCFDSSPGAREDLSGIARWPYVPQDGRYGEVDRINWRIRDMAGFLNSLEWIKSVKQVDDTFDVQVLRDKKERYYAWVTSWDSEDARQGNVSFGDFGDPFPVSLRAGDGTIIDLAKRTEIYLNVFGGE